MKERIVIDLQNKRNGRLQLGSLAELVQQDAIINVQRGALRFVLQTNARHGPQSRYWWAYKRVGGKVRRKYLGKANDLTYEKLQDAADLFIGLMASVPHRAA